MLLPILDPWNDDTERIMVTHTNITRVAASSFAPINTNKNKQTNPFNLNTIPPSLPLAPYVFATAFPSPEMHSPSQNGFAT